MKFKIIMGESIDEFENKINDFLKEAGMILDIKYEMHKEYKIPYRVAYILYQDMPLDKIKPETDVSWTSPFFEEAAKILSKNKEEYK